MTIYNSYELRWFSPHPIRGISSLFSNHNLRLKRVWNRTDRYLINRSNSFSLKFREGNIEVKLRGEAGEDIDPWGKPWYWKKWSYPMRNGNLETQFGYEDYIDVKKERILLFSHANNGQLSVNSESSSGCQLEYGRILAKRKPLYTFSLEAYGPDNDSMHEELLHAAENISFSDLGETDRSDYPDILETLS
jgi:hypothetical protein